MNNKKKALLLVVLLVVLIAVLGVSFAWYQVTLNGENSLNMVSGSLNITYATKGGSISVSDAEPQSDSDGLAQTGYTFEINNTSNVASSYTIYLDDQEITGSRMNDQYVKYVLTKDSTNTISTLNLVTRNTLENGLVSRTLVEDVIPANTKYTYTLKLWMSSEADNSQMNTKFKARIRVSNTQYTEN